MNMIAAVTRFAERAPVPDSLTLMGIDYLVGRTARRLQSPDEAQEIRFAQDMANYAIAEQTAAANEQHYELPADFFGVTLGPRRKYSCCLYDKGATTLAQAEEAALDETMRRAQLEDGQRILELGCGWGSLTLAMAERFPAASITAVSNSHSQRAYITAEAERRELGNVRVITADMNVFQAEGVFDRVVSVEMFEHMANWRPLLAKARDWLAPDGRLFIHIFTHRSQPYRFDTSDKADWIAQYFFTGGIMPSHGLIRRFPDLFEVESTWRWSGENYRRTAMDWLAEFDAHGAEVTRLMEATYGAQAPVWTRRWRLFFLATAGLFGHRGGEEWGVSHYLLRPVRA